MSGSLVDAMQAVFGNPVSEEFPVHIKGHTWAKWLQALVCQVQGYTEEELEGYEEDVTPKVNITIYQSNSIVKSLRGGKAVLLGFLNEGTEIGWETVYGEVGEALDIFLEDYDMDNAVTILLCKPDGTAHRVWEGVNA